jgi:restriction endonuclease S subunit
MSEWQKVKIGDIAIESKEIELNPDANRKIRVRLNVNGVEKRPLIAEKEGATKYYKRKTGQFIYGRQNFHKGAFGVVPSLLDGFSSSADLPAFDIDKSCLPEWLVYWFKTENRYLQLLKHARGIGSQRVSTLDFYKTEILLPDITTQQNIIDKLQTVEQKSVLFELEISNQQTYLTKLRQAILQEAIEGKLTADWRVKNPVEKGNPDTDAAALLATIKVEKQKLIADGKIKKEKPFAPINPDNVPFALPDSWVWVRLLEVSLISGGMQKTPHRTPTKNFYPYLGVQNVQRGYLNLNEVKYFEATETELERLMLVKNDLLIIEGNGSINEIGRCAIWNEEIENCIHQNHIMRCRPFINSQSNFFITVLNSKFGIEQMQEKARTTTGLFNLSVGKLGTVIMPLPPLAEQHAIVERVDRLLASVNALEQQVQERKSYAEQLMQAVLKEAFAA